MYELIFEKGSLKGKRWRVPVGGILAIGRSHSCNIRPTEPDVSGKHAIIREDGGALWLEAMSAHKTEVEGARLRAGEKKALKAGAEVSLGGGLVFRVGMTAAEGETDEILPGETATLGIGTRTYAGETGTLATAATRAAPDETGTIGTVATRTYANEAPSPDETGALGTFATRTYADETGTLSTAATRAAETGTVATVATMAVGAAGGLHGKGSFAKPATKPLRSAAGPAAGERRDVAEEGETQMVTTLTAMPSQGDTELATDDPSDGGETQVLATQAVSQTELDILRGAHLKRQKRKIGMKALAFMIVLGAVVALYAWLSNPYVNPYLVSRQTITFNGVIRTDDGQIDIKVPGWNGGRPTVSTPSYKRHDARLGDKWEVPFTIILTNYVDKMSLREDIEESFARWRTANMVGLWRDQGELVGHQFIGGLSGRYPGIQCLVHKYSRVDGDGENLAGTAAFFRLGDTCHVLMRELPAAEEGRGSLWLNRVDMTLVMQERVSGGAHNLLAARHWEGSSLSDDARDLDAALGECRDLLEMGNINAWDEIERTLYVALRSVDGRTDAEAADIRSGALDALQGLRAAQASEWKNCCTMAWQAREKHGDDGERAFRDAVERARNLFNSKSDERFWLSRQDNWWHMK